MHRIVAVTPAGRKLYLEILKAYILKDDSISEWVLWDNCRKAEDRAYIHELAAKHDKVRVLTIEGVDGTNKSVNSFYKYCDAPDSFYIKIDDDVVWMEAGLGRSLYEAALPDRSRYLWWSPLVVNNALCSWLLKYHSRVTIDNELSAQASCPYGWRSPTFAARLHQVFLDYLGNDNLAAFRVGAHDVSLSRYSINVIGFFGEDVAKLGARFCPSGVDDEEWLSAVLPTLVGRCGRIVGDVVAAHFAFYTQERHLLEQNGLIDAYYQAAGIERTAPLPPSPPLGFRQKLKAFVRGKSARRASPDIAIR
ncbi:MAG: hypothetical protein AAGC58_03485 [Asticcacaulis sp.]